MLSNLNKKIDWNDTLPDSKKKTTARTRVTRCNTISTNKKKRSVRIRVSMNNTIPASNRQKVRVMFCRSNTLDGKLYKARKYQIEAIKSYSKCEKNKKTTFSYTFGKNIYTVNLDHRENNRITFILEDISKEKNNDSTVYLHKIYSDKPILIKVTTNFETIKLNVPMRITGNQLLSTILKKYCDDNKILFSDELLANSKLNGTKTIDKNFTEQVFSGENTFSHISRTFRLFISKTN